MSSSSTSNHGGWVAYKYYPSMAAAVIFIILFISTTLLHTYHLLRTQTWFFIPLVIGGYCEYTWLRYTLCPVMCVNKTLGISDEVICVRQSRALAISVEPCPHTSRQIGPSVHMWCKARCCSLPRPCLRQAYTWSWDGLSFSFTRSNTPLSGSNGWRRYLSPVMFFLSWCRRQVRMFFPFYIF